MFNSLKSWAMLPMLFLAALFVPGCTSATAGLNSVPTIQATEHKIEPGDKIRVTILTAGCRWRACDRPVGDHCAAIGG